MTMLNESEVAERLGPKFTVLTDGAKKRRIRKIITNAGIEPYIAHARAEWLVDETYIPYIRETLCRLKSRNGYSRTKASQKPIGCEEQSKEERFLNLQKELLSERRKLLQIN